MDNSGKNWSREETILAFELYCRTPFGKIHKYNEDIIKLAQFLGRTPSSVALKMSNLAHFDLSLQSRQVNGLSHGSKFDRIIFEEFSKNLGELSYQCRLIKEKFNEKKLCYSDTNLPLGQNKEILSKERIGQDFFRNSILNFYNNSCCITGLSSNELLVASHIKPWAVSNEKNERTNPSNGLCLNALHDKAFDKGLITISQHYKIIVSDKIKDTQMDTLTREWFMSYEGKEIMLPNQFLPGREFIEYHNDVIFQR